MTEYKNKSKNSIMIPKSFIQSMTKFLKDQGAIEIEKETKYIIFQAKLDELEVLIYKSGIFLYRGNIHKLADFEKTIFDLLSSQNIHIDDFQPRTTIATRKKRGWTSVPKSIWLSKTQMDQFIQTIQEIPGISEIETELKHEQRRFKINDQILCINKNSTVHTIGGFEQFQERVEECITNHPEEYQENIITVVINNRYSKIGPIIITLLEMTRNQMIELQLRGIKHRKIMKGMNLQDSIQIIDSIIEYKYTIKIKPERINQITEDLTNKEYINEIETMIYKEINTLLEEYRGDNYTLVLDETTYKKHHEILSSRYGNFQIETREHSIPLATGSIINLNIEEQWHNEMNNKYKIPLNTANIQQIKAEQFASEVLKLKFCE